MPRTLLLVDEGEGLTNRSYFERIRYVEVQSDFWSWHQNVVNPVCCVESHGTSKAFFKVSEQFYDHNNLLFALWNQKMGY